MSFAMRYCGQFRMGSEMTCVRPFGKEIPPLLLLDADVLIDVALESCWLGQ